MDSPSLSDKHSEEPTKEVPTKEEPKEKSLSPKQRLMVRLYACGFTEEEVGVQFKIRPQSVSQVILKPEAVKYMEKVQDELDEEYKRLFGLVVDSVRVGLSSMDINIRLAASALWLKTSGREQIKVKLSAEDLIKELREVGKVKEIAS